MRGGAEGRFKILVTGSGGIGGCDFVRALRVAEALGGVKLFIVGTDYNPHHLLFPEVDVRVRTPRHRDPEFIPTLRSVIGRYGVEFLHPHPSSEARVVAENLKAFEDLGVKTYLPDAGAIAPDKWRMYLRLREAGVPVPEARLVEGFESVEEAFKDLGSPLWIRARVGAGGRLSLKVSNPEEAWMWVRLNALQGRAGVTDFMIQEYLPGRDLAFDSLWFRGELITSYVRERLEYPLKHISLTGITGTPAVARVVADDEAFEAGVKAVKALTPEPHGFFSVDMKCGEDGRPRVTEVDGKWHTTAPLWGMALSKVFGDLSYNLAYVYLALGLGLDPPEGVREAHAFPEGCYLIRQLDCGVILKCGEWVWRVA